MESSMGYVFDFNAAQEYDRWCRDPENRFVADLEDQLLLRLLKPVRGERVLDIGCGTGRHLQMFLDMGLDVTGLDASSPMLNMAKKRLGHRAALHLGFAEDLPFEDNSFNISTMITTLEFVEDTHKAVEEACRVTKDHIFLGVLNRYSLKGIERRIKGIFSKSLFNRARFFGIWGLTREVRSCVGKTPLRRATVPQLPASWNKYTQYVERLPLVQIVPFGTFIGMAVTLVPLFRTQNIPIKYVRKPNGAVSGLMQTGTKSCKKG
jgi:ubiquinone/menaquinone biosynthesis C-methylase UbiE